MTCSAYARCAALSLLLAAPAVGVAHPGHAAMDHHAYSFMAGLSHPITGLDHLCAMAVLGVWSAMTARRVWLAPLSFALALLVGALLGRAGLSMPAVEPMIALSLWVLGLLTVAKARLSVPVGMAVAALFAMFHGHAHGAEVPETASLASYIAGFMLATVALHGAGVAAGVVLRDASAWLARLLGGGVALYGLALIAA